MSERVCALCGRHFPRMEGTATENGVTVDLCHPADSTGPMTCYHRWTVYRERPSRQEPSDG